MLTYCYQYDPAMNRHTLLYVRIIQAGGVLTFLFLVTFLVVNFRRDIRKRENRKHNWRTDKKATMHLSVRYFGNF